MKSRRRNFNLHDVGRYAGWGKGAPLTRKQRAQARREFKSSVRRKRKEIDAEYVRLRKSARSGRTSSTHKLEQLFHEVYGSQENPRALPATAANQLAAIKKLIEGNAQMAQKKKSKKKKNPQKGKMPAGLKAYWARKRRVKAKRRNPSTRRRNRVRTRTRTVIKYRTRTVKVKAKRRRRKSNPRPQRSSTLNLGSGFTAGQIKKVARAVARITGQRTQVKNP